MAVMEAVQMLADVEKGIRMHSISEADKGGYEAVGFLAGRRGDARITTLMRLNNHCADPRNGFFVEPWEQFRAEKRLAESGYEIRGVYHSHPISEALPSRTDRDMARPGELMVIYSVAFDTITLWLEQASELVPITRVSV